MLERCVIYAATPKSATWNIVRSDIPVRWQSGCHKLEGSVNSENVQNLKGVVHIIYFSTCSPRPRRHATGKYHFVKVGENR